MSRLTKLIFIFLMFLFPTVSFAADKWEFVIAPYALLPYIDGDASVGQVSGADVAVDPGDILDALELGGMIYLEAQHANGFGVSLNYAFMDLADDATGPGGIGRVDLDIVAENLIAGHDVIVSRGAPGKVDLVGGKHGCVEVLRN